MIHLGRVVTGNSTFLYIAEAPININQYGDSVEIMQRNAIGSIYVTGSGVSEDVTPFELDVTPGQYYFGTVLFTPSGGIPITINTRYQNGLGGWNNITGTLVDNTHYDNGSGNLQNLATGYYAKHSLYTVGDGINETYIMFISQAEYDSLASVQTAPLPIPSSDIGFSDVLIADVIVQQGATHIKEIDDQRPVIGFKPTSISATSDHTLLSNLNLGNSGHLQFMMLNGSTPMGGTSEHERKHNH